eukprot:comp7287_c1_seq1/m.2996 comp7287_c1_seq1/g.2996  ORF comp7287_c1_seq1/g.2996 comp7287_c1_seq1/m.2996 type:complete len:302 (+) comp7287_c1_seq1:1295-2200(+)
MTCCTSPEERSAHSTNAPSMDVGLSLHASNLARVMRVPVKSVSVRAHFLNSAFVSTAPRKLAPVKSLSSITQQARDVSQSILRLKFHFLNSPLLRLTPDRSAPERSGNAAASCTGEILVRDKIAFLRMADRRSVSVRSKPDRLHPVRSTPERLARVRTEDAFSRLASNLAPARLHESNDASVRFTPVKSALAAVANRKTDPVRSAFEKLTPFMSAPTNSDSMNATPVKSALGITAPIKWNLTNLPPSEILTPVRFAPLKSFCASQRLAPSIFEFLKSHPVTVALVKSAFVRSARARSEFSR